MRNVLIYLGLVTVFSVATVFFVMRSKIAGASIVAEPSAPSASNNPTTEESPVSTPLQFVMKNIEGQDVDLASFRGRVVLIVNVASKCGFTKQYAGLQKLYEEKGEAGLVILGFPTNDFGGQEPGSDEEIRAFCSDRYNVTFPMFSKIAVKGESKAPLYRFLTEEATAREFAGEIGWNFTKFVVDRSGKLVGRFPSNVAPDSPELKGLIDRALAAQ